MNDVALSQIYINHRFTAYMKNIDKQARKAKKDGFLKYVWSTNGIIHGRVSDGSPVFNFLRPSDVIDAISDPQHPVNRSGLNINPTGDGSAMQSGNQQDKSSAMNANGRVTKRKNCDEAANLATNESEDSAEDNLATRSSQRIKKSKKEIRKK